MKTEHRSAGILFLGLSAVVWLTGCAGSPPWGGWSKEPAAPQVQAALGRQESPAFVAEHEVYRLRKLREKQYAYQQEGVPQTESTPAPTVVADAQ